jgi:hypothetical protein
MRALKEPLIFYGILRKPKDSATPAQLIHWLGRAIQLKGGASLVLQLGR